MAIMFRYMIDDVRRGGCVLANNQEQAKTKVEAHYKQFVENDFEVTIWLDGDLPEDVVEVYP